MACTHKHNITEERGNNQIETLIEDIYLLPNISKLEMIEINLIDYERYSLLLAERFSQFSTEGAFLEGTIYLQLHDDDLPDFYSIFYTIAEITGSYDVIESISAVLRIEINTKIVEYVVELIGDHKLPRLLDVSDMSCYFVILNYLSIKWLNSRNELISKSHSLL
ncbi:MAG: hypothetical protein GPJ54_17155 [Candidatus Heimdallarchaeota archaeon]|nr:hypothetical protein [Candidatus Heimdallarchaeota archaeon]